MAIALKLQLILRIKRVGFFGNAEFVIQDHKLVFKLNQAINPQAPLFIYNIKLIPSIAIDFWVKE